ncbi:MAG: DUF177 domain-containing protein [Crocinitomicaceae bacterium]|nr:DUF177 domain-containing protein [Crocinitomicaceae bacterium]
MSNKEYIIPFVGLNIGVHEFEFVITDAFFEGIEYSIVHKGNVKVRLALDKKETMLVGNYSLEGTVSTSCDRCNEPVDIEIEGSYQLVYKFDDEPTDDESLIIVYPEEFELDIKENILELITVSLPARAIHEEGECDEEMMKVLDEYTVNSENDRDSGEDEGDEGEDDDDDIDPRWEALRKLK